MRSNHYHLAASLARLGIIQDPMCKCNESEENLNHVILKCKLYNEQRITLIKDLEKMKISEPLNIETIITEPNIDACKCILNFFKECNMKI